MNTTTKILIFLITCISILGCTPKTKHLQYSQEEIASLQLDSTKRMRTNSDITTHIDLNPLLDNGMLIMDTIIENVSIIPLETTESSILDNIQKIIFTNTHIYIYDRYKDGGIVIFDKKGRFKTRIKNGPAPHELQRLYDIAYDYKKDMLIAFKHSYLMFFTPEGEFINQAKLPLGFYNLAKTSDGYIFKTIGKSGNNHFMDLEKYRLYICDESFKVKEAHLYSDRVDDPLIGTNYITKLNNCYKITEAYNDTIYCYSNSEGTIKAEYIIDFSDKKISEDCLVEDKKFFNTIREKDVFYFLGRYFETNTHQAFVLNNRFRNQNTTIFRDKRSGNMYGGSSLARILTELPSLTPIASIEDGFISLHYYSESDTLLQASSILSLDDKNKLKQSTEEDNPIIVIYNLK